MLTTFILTQVAINLVLIVCLAGLLRQRQASLRLAQEREDRLEALAAEICDVGSQIARQAPADAAPASPLPESATSEPAGARIAETSAENRGDVGVTERIRGATALLEQGGSLDEVAAETALFPGELQVLRNLRRAAKPRDQRPRAAATRAVKPGAHRSSALARS
jgi:hypothetical protein